ncbi:MAG TPA: hypothetical protein VIT38_11430 [Allosphingosinicella sp.]
MKTRIALLVLSIAIPAGAASAQQGGPVQGSVALDAIVAGRCTLGPPSRNSIPIGQLSNSSGARVGRLATIPDQQISLPGSWCNFANTTMTVEARALVALDANPVQAGFARAVNYTSTVTNWAATNAATTTAATVAGSTPSSQGVSSIHPEPKLADVTLILNNFTVPSDGILVSGAYAGAVTITLGPAS